VTTLPADLALLASMLDRIGVAARVVAETGSTNDDARAWAAEGAPDFAVVVADAQSRGRGRHGRSWSAPAGASLAVSIVVRPALAPAQLPPLSHVAGLAARTAIASRLPARDVAIKWPNDIVVRGGDAPVGRKIAGILVEGAIAGARVEHAIVGLGVNVARLDFPDDLAARATSLAVEGATSLDRGALVVDVVDALRAELARFVDAPTSIGARLAPFDALEGVRVRIEGGARGVGSGVASDGRLLVRDDDGALHAANAGEVTVDARG
jgi:BirA family biotin operon repressor/biotin-[acetyl-CoA-carboxylase] ligase